LCGTLYAMSKKCKEDVTIHDVFPGAQFAVALPLDASAPDATLAELPRGCLALMAIADLAFGFLLDVVVLPRTLLFASINAARDGDGGQSGPERATLQTAVD
jgi:hypothetical protein